ncbi:MAG: hypothetical protein KatS3mg115_1362 [Candidatus Poribacteria bacterium]|nr:MAG: hypothetical protein KatS3mg115_1362 [Candidatus Poribacteria bacterium]
MENAEIVADQELDVRGLQCPMPMVRASQTVRGMESGQVLRVLATDRGSVPDFQAWAKRDRTIELLKQEEQKQPDGTVVYVHYVRRR